MCLQEMNTGTVDPISSLHMALPSRPVRALADKVNLCGQMPVLIATVRWSLLAVFKPHQSGLMR
jgi:hypothetical protein